MCGARRSEEMKQDVKIKHREGAELSKILAVVSVDADGSSIQ